MSTRNLVYMLAAILIAAYTAFFIRNRVAAPEQQQAEAPATRILVAKRDIPPGSFVNAGQDMDWAAWPAEAMQEAYIREGVEPITTFQGAVARRAIKTGEPVAANAIIKSGAGGFLSAVLEPGKRAISIEVNATSGNAGFIFPGDKVDLIVTHRVKQTDATGAEEQAVISETFAENVRVVAVDQQLDNPENKAILAKTVTLEVSPKEAEKIQIAIDLGKVSVALRSLSDTATNNIGNEDFVTTLDNERRGGFTRDSEVSPVLERTTGGNPRIRVMRGPNNERLEFTRESR